MYKKNVCLSCRQPGQRGGSTQKPPSGNDAHVEGTEGHAGPTGSHTHGLVMPCQLPNLTGLSYLSSLLLGETLQDVTWVVQHHQHTTDQHHTRMGLASLHLASYYEK